MMFSIHTQRARNTNPRHPVFANQLLRKSIMYGPGYFKRWPQV